MSEDMLGNFTFTVYPTRVPNDTVLVRVVAPISPNNEPYLVLRNDGDICETGFKPVAQLEFSAGEAVPQNITVVYNVAAEKLNITDFDLLLTLYVVGEQILDKQFTAKEQPVLPIDIKLLPSVDSEAARAVSIVESKIEVAEDSLTGFNASYDLYLRPCTDEMMQDTVVYITATVDDQLNFTNEIGYHDWNGTDDCMISLNVAAFDDIKQEGDHFVTLNHEVMNITSDGGILLLDNSTLLARSILVQIYDDDIPGVIVKETLGVTATAELRKDEETDLQASVYGYLYEDTYSVRLTKEPQNGTDVHIIATSLPTGSEIGDTANDGRIQVYVNGDQKECIRLSFNSSNWLNWMDVKVTAIDDDEEEGVDWYNFASQPSFLGPIQGPVALYGGFGPVFPPIRDAVLLPNEFEADTFAFPPELLCRNDTSTFEVKEPDQVDTLKIYNEYVRGNEPSTGTLFDNNFKGMNMGRNLVINFTDQVDGIEYYGMEVIEFYLGDGVDSITVENTSEAIHVMYLAGGDDSLRVKEINGPMMIYGGDGTDTVTVFSDEEKLDSIQALLTFDGQQTKLEAPTSTQMQPTCSLSQVPSNAPSTSFEPTTSPRPSSEPSVSFYPSESPRPSGEPSTPISVKKERVRGDQLILINTGDEGVDDVLKVSRMRVEVPSMGIPGPPTVQPSRSPTPRPSSAPTVSSKPSLSTRPSDEPSFSLQPSSSTGPSSLPSVSLQPSGPPSGEPSLSHHPTGTLSSHPSQSLSPSSAPSSPPSMSDVPSGTPTISSQPSVSTVPTHAPSTSVQPSSLAMPEEPDKPDGTPLLPRNSYFLQLIGARSGSFDVLLYASASHQIANETFIYATTTAADIQKRLQDALFPDSKSCGSANSSTCSQSVKVQSVGAGFAVFIVGEYLNKGVMLQVDISNLEFNENEAPLGPELFMNKTQQVLKRNSDVLYSNLDALDIYMGKASVVANIRGTTAVTSVFTQDFDDQIFVSSDANETPVSFCFLGLLSLFFTGKFFLASFKASTKTFRRFLSLDVASEGGITSGASVDVSDSIASCSAKWDSSLGILPARSK